MKRILLAAVISLAIAGMVYAQQATTTDTSTQPVTTNQSATTAQSTPASTIPSADETKQNAQQLLDQSNANSAQFDATLADLKTLNLNNADAATYNRLKTEIASIEANINAEEAAIRANLEKGSRLNSEALNQLEQLIAEHKEKTTQLQTFVQSIH